MCQEDTNPSQCSTDGSSASGHRNQASDGFAWNLIYMVVFTALAINHYSLIILIVSSKISKVLVSFTYCQMTQPEVRMLMIHHHSETGDYWELGVFFLGGKKASSKQSFAHPSRSSSALPHYCLFMVRLRWWGGRVSQCKVAGWSELLGCAGSFVGNCFVSINTLKAQQGQSDTHAWFYNSTPNGAVLKNKQLKSLWDEDEIFIVIFL